MTLLDLCEQADAPPVKKRRVDLVADYFRAHPNTWIDGFVFREFAGGYGGWSARIREAKKRFGMQIENRVRTVHDHELGCPGLQAWDMPEACRCTQGRVYKVSEYRFLPKVEQE